MTRTILCFAAALLASSFAQAEIEIQKCADRDGGITYQDAPCAKGKTLATLPRAPAYADPAALRVAEAERLQLERAMEARARLAVLDASRDAIARGVPPRLDLPAYDVGPPIPYEPYYYALPSYGGRGRPERTGRRGAANAPAASLSPGILDTPAPCRTLQCQQRAAAAARR
jgi:uncharacterized protein DUF4124